MKHKKLNGFEYSDREPKAGDILICIQRKNFNYKHLSQASEQNVRLGIIDTANWKVVENMEERKEKLVDAVIEELKDDFKHGDYTVLDELLKFIPLPNLVQSLPEEMWKNFPELTLKDK